MNTPARSIVFMTESRAMLRRTPKEEADQREVMSVVLAQPHRRGARNERLGTALGRFCVEHKPHALGDHLFAAGERYGEIIRQFKNAMGFQVPGWAPSDGGYEILTDAQAQAKKELAIRRKKEAEEIIIAIIPRAPRALERLTFDDLPPSPYDEGLIVACLVRLAQEWGLAPRSIRDLD